MFQHDACSLFLPKKKKKKVSEKQSQMHTMFKFFFLNYEGSVRITTVWGGAAGAGAARVRGAAATTEPGWASRAAFL